MARQSTKKPAAGDGATGNAATADTTSNVDATTTEAAPATAPTKPKRPNVKLAGKAEPLGAGELTIGMTVAGELPDADTQRKGWHCDFAVKLVQCFSDRYKLIVEKGN